MKTSLYRLLVGTLAVSAAVYAGVAPAQSTPGTGRRLVAQHTWVRAESPPEPDAAVGGASDADTSTFSYSSAPNSSPTGGVTNSDVTWRRGTTVRSVATEPSDSPRRLVYGRSAQRDDTPATTPSPTATEEGPLTDAGQTDSNHDMVGLQDSWIEQGGGCADGHCDTGWDSLLARGRGRWFAGAEFLLVRPHFSEATAYVRVTGSTSATVIRAGDETVSYHYDYEPNVRAFFGYRLCECCADLRFTYTRLHGDDSVSEATVGATNVPRYFVISANPGDVLTSQSDVHGNVYDVEFTRSFQLGGSCDPCDPCPRWDLRWSAGARLADMGYDNQVFTNDVADGRLDISMDYLGAGPRVGLEGRRSFGTGGQFSLYSSLDVSLLLGQYEHQFARTVEDLSITSINSFHTSVTRMAPVTEIEIGASWTPSPRWTLSAGWFFQAWWDLGMSEQQASNLLGGTNPGFLLDDANIMSWDGLTLRAEFVF